MVFLVVCDMGLAYLSISFLWSCQAYSLLWAAASMIPRAGMPLPPFLPEEIPIVFESSVKKNFFPVKNFWVASVPATLHQAGIKCVFLNAFYPRSFKQQKTNGLGTVISRQDHWNILFTGFPVPASILFVPTHSPNSCQRDVSMSGVSNPLFHVEPFDGFPLLVEWPPTLLTMHVC